jgi:hypothetical protein
MPLSFCQCMEYVIRTDVLTCPCYAVASHDALNKNLFLSTQSFLESPLLVILSVPIYICPTGLLRAGGPVC